ncbi:glycosyltransferase [Streptomyces sp. NBC_01317]|uniref:glycosyltransferase n=1 Tax=Streptomyces sp. NBC_01317 TaxID=2903822 RepID=UPI002E10A6E8|nr:glycosyltransferase [Streptomyces sp. NBC_01317]
MRLLFTSVPVQSHLAPLLPLVTAARDRGHEVLFVTGPDGVRHPEALGLPAVAAGPPFAESAGRYRRAYPADVLSGLSAEERVRHLLVHGLIEIAAAEMAEDVAEVVRAWRPDLVVAGPAERAGVIAAASAGVPYVLEDFGPPRSAAFAEPGWRAVEEVVGRGGPGRGRRLDRVPCLEIWPASMRPDGTVAGGAGEWEFTERWPLRADHVTPEPAQDAQPALLDGLPFEKTVYVTLGTGHGNLPGVLETMIRALHGERVNVVVTLGTNGDPARFAGQPPYVRIERYVPQKQLLPYVDMVICHAGAGTVLGALAHGVPLVVAPLAADQYDIAAQVVRARVGLLADPGEAASGGGLSADAVRHAFRTVAGDEGFRERGVVVAGEIAAMPSPGRVVDRLVAYAAR